MVPSALLDVPSLPTLIFSVYMFTLLRYCVGENRNKKKKSKL